MTDRARPALRTPFTPSFTPLLPQFPPADRQRTRTDSLRPAERTVPLWLPAFFQAAQPCPTAAGQKWPVAAPFPGVRNHFSCDGFHFQRVKNRFAFVVFHFHRVENGFVCVGFSFARVENRFVRVGISFPTREFSLEFKHLRQKPPFSAFIPAMITPPSRGWGLTAGLPPPASGPDRVARTGAGGPALWASLAAFKH